MKSFTDLNTVQQNRVYEALEKIDGYRTLELEEVDPEESVNYDSFRKDLEGVKLERGEMSEDDLEGYLKAGIINETEEGDLEINSVWQPGHIEKLRENQMLDYEFENLYVVRDEEEGIEKAVYGNEDAFRVSMSHGGELGFGFDEDVSGEKEQRQAEAEVERMVAEFMWEIDETAEGDRSSYIQNFDIKEFVDCSNYTRNPKPGSFEGGENTMTADYDTMEEVYAAVSEGEIDDIHELNEVADEVMSEDPTMAEKYNEAVMKMGFTQGIAEDLEEFAGLANEEANALVDNYRAASYTWGSSIQFARRELSAAREAHQNLVRGYKEAMNRFQDKNTAIADSASTAREQIDEATDRIIEVSKGLEGAVRPDFSSKEAEEAIEETNELMEAMGLDGKKEYTEE